MGITTKSVHITSDGTEFSGRDDAAEHEAQWQAEQEHAAARAAWLVVVEQFADDVLEQPEPGPGRTRLINSTMRWIAWLKDQGYGETLPPIVEREDAA